ncbi:MAG: FeoB-associated Cys-rich membrane protein [Desulfobacterales bacterium]|nr:FeoB-associated Cys-rich membrane protein [Desulfobacterales bacterium]
MDNLMVTLIVSLAVAYIFKTFYKKFKKRSEMNCGCSGCDVGSETCEPLSSERVKKEVEAAGNKTLNCDPKKD